MKLRIEFIKKYDLKYKIFDLIDREKIDVHHYDVRHIILPHNLQFSQLKRLLRSDVIKILEKK